jgi:tetratricopeptide (TPR) repeat protein
VAESHSGALEGVRQQITLWMLAGDRACMERRFIRGLRYYDQALELAEEHRLDQFQARLYRDLAYVYIHHDAPEKALDLIAQGLALEPDDPELRLGLLVNKTSAYLTLRDYNRCHAATREAIDYFQQRYPRLAGASSGLVATHVALVKLERQLKRVVDLLESGINPDRIEIAIEFARPFWMKTNHT